MKWNDESSYSRGERGRVEPTAWRLAKCPLRLVVHRLHGIPGHWFVSANEVGIDRRQLDATEVEAAKREGIALVVQHLEFQLDTLKATQLPGGDGKDQGP